MSVGKLLVASMIIWAVLAIVTHGVGILVYLGIQFATTGLFSFAFIKVEKLYGN